jgi:hypothetical protein
MSKDSKEELIKRLWQFEDNCGHIYSRRANCLAVSSTGEFSDCDEGLLQLIIKDTLKATYTELSSLVRKTNIESLLETDLVKVLEAFLSLILEGVILEETKNQILNDFKDYWRQNKKTFDLLKDYDMDLIAPKINPDLYKHIAFSESEYLDMLEEFQAYDEYLDEQYEEFNSRIGSEKNDEILINLYESYKTHPEKRLANLIIDKLISVSPESDTSIRFILRLLEQDSMIFDNKGFILCDEFLYEPVRIMYKLILSSQPISEMLSLSIINHFRKYIIKSYERESRRDKAFNELLSKCSENLSYSDFYEALHRVP